MLPVATATMSWSSIHWDLIIGGFALFLFGIQSVSYTHLDVYKRQPKS